LPSYILGIFFVMGVSFGMWGLVTPIVHAQSYGGTIATARHISGGTPRVGDVVSLDPHTGIFYISYSVSDKNMVGIVAKNPTLLLSDKSGGTPVTTSGQAIVNVSTTNGRISVGDYLTSSAIAGAAEKASKGTPYIIGTALSSFPPIASTTQATNPASGQTRVLLSIGSNPALVAGNTNTLNGSATDAAATAAGASIIFHIIKYILAALVTAGTIYIAFRTSRSAMDSGIISIGRNPLAKRSIRSMLFADTAVIILISIVGLAMALALVLVPV